MVEAKYRERHVRCSHEPTEGLTRSCQNRSGGEDFKDFYTVEVELRQFKKQLESERRQLLDSSASLLNKHPAVSNQFKFRDASNSYKTYSVEDYTDSDLDLVPSKEFEQFTVLTETYSGSFNFSNMTCSPQNVTILSSEDQRVLRNILKNWRNLVESKHQKIDSTKKTVREQKVNKFLDKITQKINESKNKNLMDDYEAVFNLKTEKKNINKDLSKDPSIYSHRFKNQQVIIQNQKSKLEEQQKMILSLKTDKIKLENELTIKKTDEIFQEAIDKISSQGKLALKGCESLYKISKPVHVSELVRRMEERAEERRIKREQLNQLRKQKEEAQKLLELEKIETKKRLEIEKRKEQLREKREKEEIERLVIEKKEADILRMERLNFVAENFYSQLLIKTFWSAWKRRTEHLHEMESFCRELFNRSLTFKCFNLWKITIFYTKQFELEKAGLIYDELLKRKSWSQWTKITKISSIQKQVAIDFFDFNLQKNFFDNWLRYAAKKQFEIENKIIWAKNYYKKKLVENCLRSLREFPQVQEAERARDLRIHQWSTLVQQLLPDFAI